jgi:hypothetical protein
MKEKYGLPWGGGIRISRYLMDFLEPSGNSGPASHGTSSHVINKAAEWEIFRGPDLSASGAGMDTD